MPETYFNLMDSDGSTFPDTGFNYRWVQPPQIVYLVSTIDLQGNHNITPLTLGTCVGVNMVSSKTSNYFYTLSVGSVDLPHVIARHACQNLKAVPECVISYPGAELMEKIWVSALPYPPGIEEMKIAGLTPLPSRQVKPSGIQECPVNMEARVVSSCQVGEHYTLFVCQVVGVSVEQALLEKDAANPLHYGVLEIDPLFETTIAPEDGKAPRMYFGKIDRQNLQRTPDEMGSSKVWTGNFADWMEDECSRGKITPQEKETILGLNRAWTNRPDPAENARVKAELTDYLRKIVWGRNDV